MNTIILVGRPDRRKVVSRSQTASSPPFYIMTSSVGEEGSDQDSVAILFWAPLKLGLINMQSP